MTKEKETQKTETVMDRTMVMEMGLLTFGSYNVGNLIMQ